MIIKELTRSSPELSATNKTFAHVFIDRHIDITTTKALFFICKAIATRERTQSFSQNTRLLTENRNLASLSLTDSAGSFKKIASIKLLGKLSCGVLKENLNTCRVVLNNHESQFTETTDASNATSGADFLVFILIKTLQDIFNFYIAICMRRIRIDTFCAKFV